MFVVIEKKDPLRINRAIDRVKSLVRERIAVVFQGDLFVRLQYNLRASDSLENLKIPVLLCFHGEINKRYIILNKTSLNVYILVKLLFKTFQDHQN